MCGIFGVYNFDRQKVSRDRSLAAVKKINHRGPDFQKVVFYNDEAIALGHARLSIIDLSDVANQPMETDKYSVVFNGEIYNYIEIREELKTAGYNFTTNSDTEVLIHAYDYWKDKCVEKFNGMWAFTILCKKTGNLFCSRDRFGVKPFNYYYDKKKLIFCSEIKSILEYDPALKVPNYNSIGLFCREGICGEIEETWFEGIKRLMPGHNMYIVDGDVKIKKYYDFPTDTIDISFNDAKIKFKEIFDDAVKLRMRSDVPVGTTLSGGLDSSSIVSSVRTFFKGEHDTFTAHFPDFKDDEYANAKKTNEALDLTGNPIIIKYGENYLEVLEEIIYHLESGHLSPSIFPLWRVYEQSTKKVTVLLEGQGADELLGGYIASFGGSFLKEQLGKGNIKNFLKQFSLLNKNYNIKSIATLYLRANLPIAVRTFIRRNVLKYENIFDGHIKTVSYPEKTKNSSNSPLKNQLQESHQTTLVNLLHYGDALSMAFGLESRLPFMDYRLVNFCYTLPAEYLINDGKGKYILREAMKDDLPKHIYEDAKKLGFPSPVDKFFRENKELLKSILLSEKSKARNIFNSTELEYFINNRMDKNSGERVIFRAVCVELWFKTFIDK
ncbi:asparagine synthase (glutamine-hydrolyzing) [Chryseobacterium chendengshani]|uniref:asparagine synthase (glutamine-hydrolyzing) n=1 Tax=Chryseobacterium sp. LJ756 TaxID=2864113 RepID=UPI001C644B69|nr:asparagine synthase (glutamine-hydrolyzing) [Chryseobacterium sp. LJ756]MBW7676617.1 asparagine synthase (glutamine-hydrolyzing) [Chryseobacterium sp. LJ756]